MEYRVVAPVTPIDPERECFPGSGPLVVGLGEALYDCFPTRVALGGAPVNVAVHTSALLSRIGGKAVPATRVGVDAFGERFFGELAERGVGGDYVQVDPSHPTGKVQVDVDSAGHAAYRFPADVAWDHLESTPAWDRLAGRCDAVVFGTLAQRTAKSAETVHRFVAAASRAVRLFDVNLRGSYYSPETLERSLRVASALKLNAEELDTVVDPLDLPGGAPHGMEDRVELLRMAFGLDWVALTRGAKGTLLFLNGERLEGRQVNSPLAEGADSVGAGDACCAGLITGFLLGAAPLDTLGLANEVGAFVASQPGATPRLPASILDRVAELAAKPKATH